MCWIARVFHQWGPNLPDFIDARMTPRRLGTVVKTVMKDRSRLKMMLALKSSLSRPRRPWQR